MKVKILAIAFGVVLVIIGKFFFGHNFSDKLSSSTCFDSGFCNDSERIRSQKQVLATVLFITTGTIVILAGLIYKNLFIISPIC